MAGIISFPSTVLPPTNQVVVKSVIVFIILTSHHLFRIGFIKATYYCLEYYQKTSEIMLFQLEG